MLFQAVLTIHEDEDALNWLMIVIKTGERKKLWHGATGELEAAPSGWELRSWAHIVRKLPWQKEEKNWKIGSRSPLTSSRFDIHSPWSWWTIKIINHWHANSKKRYRSESTNGSIQQPLVHLIIHCVSFKHPTRVTTVQACLVSVLGHFVSLFLTRKPMYCRFWRAMALATWLRLNLGSSLPSRQ